MSVAQLARVKDAAPEPLVLNFNEYSALDDAGKRAHPRAWLFPTHPDALLEVGASPYNPARVINAVFRNFLSLYDFIQETDGPGHLEAKIDQICGPDAHPEVIVLKTSNALRTTFASEYWKSGSTRAWLGVLALGAAQHPQFREALLATGDRPIHYYCNHPEWGMPSNGFGKLLVQIREQLKLQPAPAARGVAQPAAAAPRS